MQTLITHVCVHAHTDTCTQLHSNIKTNTYLGVNYIKFQHTCHGLDKFTRSNLLATVKDDTESTVASGTMHNTKIRDLGCNHLSSIIALNSSIRNVTERKKVHHYYSDPMLTNEVLGNLIL